MQQKFAPKTWPTWIGFGLLSLTARLPLAAQYWLGDRLGDLALKLVAKRRQIAKRNLDLCFPELDGEARRALLEQHFRSLGRMLFESGFAWRGQPARVSALGKMRGMDHVHRAQQAGQGVLLLSGHFTTLEIGACYVGMEFDQAAGLYREHDNPALEHLVYRSRKRYVTEMFDRSQTRAAVRFLRRGGLLWYAPDQDYRRGDSVFVPLFGIPAATTTSTLELARLGKAQVMVLDQRRRADGSGYELEISAPWENFPSGDATADVARINEAIEAMIRKVPEQYMWVHRRFKRRPAGEADLYR